MSPEQLRANDLAKMNGALSWLTTLPLKSKKFNLNKREFYNTFSLRHCWTLKYLPCRKRFDVDHAVSCMEGGSVRRRYDDVRDLFASLFMDVCHDFEVEPHLKTSTGEVLTCSECELLWWSSFECQCAGFLAKWATAFFGVGVFNPLAKSHLNQKTDTAFSSNENEKKRQYNQWIIEVEHGSFSPLVFSPYGGNGREAERFLTELALKLSGKNQMDYSIPISWRREKLSFNLLRSAVLCVRGYRTTKHELNSDFSGAEIGNVIGKINK